MRTRRKNMVRKLYIEKGVSSVLHVEIKTGSLVHLIYALWTTLFFRSNTELLLRTLKIWNLLNRNHGYSQEAKKSFICWIAIKVSSCISMKPNCFSWSETTVGPKGRENCFYFASHYALQIRRIFESELRWTISRDKK